MMQFHVALVGHTGPSPQALLTHAALVGSGRFVLLPIPAGWEENGVQKSDPNAIQVWYEREEGQTERVGHVINRSRCRACDPEEQTFGYPDYDVPSICPRCGGPLMRGVATQVAEALRAGKQFRVVPDRFYVSSRGARGMFYWIREA